MTRREWASAILERARQLGPLPRYGDEAWQALPSSDPRFVAAVVVAAECWATESDPAEIQARQALEVQAMRQEREAHEAAEFAAMARQIRQSANAPSHDELALRRRQRSGAA